MVERFDCFSLAVFEISRYWHKLAAMYRYADGATGPQLCGFAHLRELSKEELPKP